VPHPADAGRDGAGGGAVLGTTVHVTPLPSTRSSGTVLKSSPPNTTRTPRTASKPTDGWDRRPGTGVRLDHVVPFQLCAGVGPVIALVPITTTRASAPS
jgi:hypothetical protein